MPLSDPFKKPPKKEPIREDPFGSPELQKKRYDAAREIVNILQHRFFSPEGKAHAGTVLSTAARLAGTSLYRSLNYKNDIAPGTVVLSEEVNEKWPQLMNLFAFYCKQNGIDVMSKPLVTVFPETDKPHLETAQVLLEFQDRFHEIMKKHDLGYLDGARAGMLACAIIFNYHCAVAKDIDPYVATGMVAMGVVEGAKTAPPPLQPAGSQPDSTGDSRASIDQVFAVILQVAENSIDGSGNRLVIGEGMAAMGEAVRTGGRYILVHPEVLEKLKENGIDVFLIYAAAMRKEIASKISQIDFVGGNVEELAQQWKGKQETQIPIPVRQLQWLKDNAGSYGYEQRGNSWILKNNPGE